jgi:hypothetical protein
MEKDFRVKGNIYPVAITMNITSNFFKAFLLVIFLCYSCTSYYYWGDKKCKEIVYPFLVISFDEYGQKAEKEFITPWIGKKRLIKATDYSPNGKKERQGWEVEVKETQCLSRIDLIGKHKYWLPDGKLIWVETYKKGRAINPIPDSLLQKIKRLDPRW